MPLCPDRSTSTKTCFTLLATAILLAWGRPSLAASERPADLPNKTDESYLHIDDDTLYASLLQGLTELFENGKTTKMATLKRQLGRDHGSVELPDISTKETALPELYRRCKSGVLIVGGLYMCEKCGKRHVSTVAGFVLTASGVIATAYHAVDRSAFEALGAMTPDGKVYAVKEVVAASSLNDVAILQLDGSGFRPLPLAANAPVGTSVAMIGHPSRQFYMLTTGTISRYYALDYAGIETLWMSATAEIGSGASGAPLLNTSGAVVGMASRTRPVYAAAHDNEPRRLQMVIKQYVPASAILDLLSSDDGSEGRHPDSPRQFIARMASLVRSRSWDTLERKATGWMTDHPNDLSTSIMLARLLMSVPDEESRRLAEQILRRILVTDPNSIDALRMLAVLLQTQGRDSEAAELNRRLLEFDPNDVVATNNLAWILSEEMRQHEEALALAQKALKLAPEYADLLDTHGVICWRLKRYDEAEASLKEALRVYAKNGSVPPASVASRFHLAQVYWESGRKEEAGDLFQECLRQQKKTGGLSPEQTAQANRRCKELSTASERPGDQ